MRGVHHDFWLWRPLRWLTRCNVSRGRSGLHSDRRIRFLSRRNGGQADVRRWKKVRIAVGRLVVANFAAAGMFELILITDVARSSHFGKRLSVRRTIDRNASEGHWVVGRQCIGRNRLRPIATKYKKSNSIITTMYAVFKKSQKCLIFKSILFLLNDLWREIHLLAMLKMRLFERYSNNMNNALSS